MAYITRNRRGESTNHASLRDAVNAYNSDKTILFICFGDMQWASVSKNSSGYMEATFCNYSQIYAEERNGDRNFWVNWRAVPEPHIDSEFARLREEGVSHQELNTMWNIACVKEVATEESFFNRFGP
jgi:hypothetical protein